MNIFFRVDASSKIGIGHLARCKVLADEFKNKGAKVNFLCGKLTLDIMDLLSDYGVETLPNDYSVDRSTESLWSYEHTLADANNTINIIKDCNLDLIVVDHYGIDYRWHNFIRPYVKYILVIDDLANRRLDCDILLDQNYYVNYLDRYSTLVDKDCMPLLGPSFILLRDEFINADKLNCFTNKAIKKILVFMGGGDFFNTTAKVIIALDQMDLDLLRVDVVVSSSNPFKDEIREKCKNNTIYNYYQDVNNMALLCSKADIAIGGGGVAALERCYLGLPSIVITTAINQIETLKSLDMIGAVKSIGWHESVIPLNISDSIVDLEKERNDMCINAKNIFNKSNFLGAKGVVDLIMNRYLIN